MKPLLIVLLAASLAAQTPALWLDFSDGTDKAGNTVAVKSTALIDGALRSKKGNDCTVKTSALLNAMTTEITIAAWVALKTVDENFQTVLFKGDRSKNPEAIQYALSINYGYPELKWKDEKGVWQGFMKSSADTKTGAVKNAVRLAVGKWQHLAVTFSAGAICVYVNGVLTEKAPAKDGAKAFVASETDIYPGAMFWAATGRNYWQDGLIADLRVYGSVLDAAAIKAIADSDAKRSVNTDVAIE